MKISEWSTEDLFKLWQARNENEHIAKVEMVGRVQDLQASIVNQTAAELARKVSE